MIRPARHVDTFPIVTLMKELHEKSRYALVDTVDEKAARQMVAQFVQRHGGTNDGGSLVMVSVKDQKIEGFIMGMLDRLYHLGHKLMATDVFFYMSDKADKTDAVKLVKAYVDWASANPRVAEIKLSYTDAVPDAERIGHLYLKLGFRKAGAIWTRDNLPAELGVAA